MSESLELIDEPNFNLFDVIERIEQSDSSEEVILQYEIVGNASLKCIIDQCKKDNNIML